MTSATQVSGMKSTGQTGGTPESGSGAIAGSLGLGLVTAAVVGRVSFPSEDAAGGSGTLFLLFSWLACLLLGLGTLGHRWRIRPVFVGVWGLLLIWIWFSAFHAEYRFPAMVMAWEWTTMGIVVLLLANAAARVGPRGFAGVLAVLTLWQAAFALWQVAVDFPGLRRQYEAKAPSFLADMAAIGVTPGSSEERLFRDRLYAGEPYGTFGHPNSLAGLLVLGLPPLIALTMSAPIPVVFRSLMSAVVAGVVLSALLLTKSRSAWIAAPMAFVFWWWFASRRLGRWRIPRLLPIFGVCGLATIIVSLSLAGFLDLLVITESVKSFAYRLEWWQGSLQVVGESPLWGVGYGNFGSHYLAYKLPFSSEEITDPHNFLLELACSVGIPAAVLYVVALIVAGYSAIGGQESESLERGQRSIWPLLGCFGGGGLVLLFPMAGGASEAAVVLGAMTAAFFWSCIGIRERPGTRGLRMALLGGVFGLHVHWLAAGGVGFPALLGVCWFGLAGCQTGSTFAAKDERKVLQVIPLATIVLLFGLFLITLYLPVQRRDQSLLQIRSNDVRSIELALKRSAQSIPGDQSGWLKLAQWHSSRLVNEDKKTGVDGVREYNAALEYLQRAIALEPARSSNYARLAVLYGQAEKMGLDADAAAKCLAAWEMALQKYPNLADRRFSYALALEDAGQREKGIEQFRLSLMLDQTPHPDKKLTEDQRRIAKERVAAH